MATVATQLWVCQDCILMLANGQMPESQSEEYQATFLARFTAGIERETAGAPAHVVPGGEHHCGEHHCGEHHCGDAWRDGDCDCEDGGFRWSECDLCRDGLGGDRYAATVLTD